MNVKRISTMENYLNECSSAISNLESALDKVESIQKDIAKLFSYYGSDVWYKDREGDVPKDVPCGVLSEDLVYDQITAVREVSFRMLTLATDMLKKL